MEAGHKFLLVEFIPKLMLSTVCGEEGGIETKILEFEGIIIIKGISLGLSFRAVVPNLFCSTDRFHVRHYFRDWGGARLITRK